MQKLEVADEGTLLRRSSEGEVGVEFGIVGAVAQVMASIQDLNRQTWDEVGQGPCLCECRRRTMEVHERGLLKGDWEEAKKQKGQDADSPGQILDSAFASLLQEEQGAWSEGVLNPIGPSSLALLQQVARLVQIISIKSNCNFRE